MPQLSNAPPKGTYDWQPAEFALRKYIFDTWRNVCQKFGYEEYLTPLVEYADLYRQKSGEDIANTELTVFTDRGGRELAIRPEMTPSVTRLVSKIYPTSPKPLRLFSIANFYRNEKPQRGRNREFWQLNFDIFGSDSLICDLEILQIALDIMLAFNPPQGSFTLRINNRFLIDDLLSQIPQIKLTSVFRILDKFEKIPLAEIENRLSQLELSAEAIQKLITFTSSASLSDLANKFPEIAQTSQGFQQTQALLSMLTDLGYGPWIKFSPNILRGFDYYDGMVFEVFDNNPANQRSMFGGGRYNGLAGIFGSQSFPAVGCAPGDETTRLFLESWNIVPKLTTTPTKILVTIFSADQATQSLNLSALLRSQGINTELYPDSQTKLEKQLKYASEKSIPYVAIIGPDESQKGLVTLKSMATGEQKTLPTNDLPPALQ